MRCLLITVLTLAACRGDAGPNGGPARVVSLMPSGTEVIAALGATDKLVGVDDYSTYPEHVKTLPKVGSYLAPNLEAIIRLRPTLVVVDDIHGATAKILTDAKISVVPCKMHGLADVTAAITELGGRLGRTQEATAVTTRIATAIEAAKRAKVGAGRRVLAIIDRDPQSLGGLVAAGPHSWLDELLGLVGAENVLAQAHTEYPKISREEVLRANPDVILELTLGGKVALTAWNELAEVPAVATKRVIAVTEPTLLAPSPRADVALGALATLLSTPAQ